MPKQSIPIKAQPRENYFAFEGGLDLITPPMSLKPGFAIDCLNFDIPATGGYRRLPGYERFDGRPKPSSANATTLAATTTFDAAVLIGDTLNGATSGATGKVVFIAPDRTYLSVTKATGNFVAGEVIRKVTTPVATLGTLTANISGETFNQIAAAAADEYRNDIGAVPGSGSVLGVWDYKGTIYAFRNNSGGTAAQMWQSSAAGWVQITFGEEVRFTNGNTGLAEGNTLTQGAVTSTIRRLIITSGTLAAGTAAGKMVVTGRAGGNYAAGAATGTGSVTLSGAQTAIVLPPNGKYRFFNHNFAGGTSSQRMYGANGIGRSFEFDGTTLVPIDTGMASDAPTRVWVHRNHLFLSFGSSVQHSAPGSPFVWSVVLGAAEIAVGDDVTDFSSGPGQQGTGALIIHTRNRTWALYGNSVSDWNLQPANPNVGARPHTVQSVREPIFLDQLGITSLSASQNFGNFSDAQISQLVRPYVADRIDAATASVVVRKENQYKIFYSDNTGLTITYRGASVIGILPFLLAHTVNVTCESERDGGSVFIGCTNGFVYELNRGRSFDGAAIAYSMRLAFNFNGTPKLRKRYRRATFDVTAPSYAKFNLSYLASRGDSDIDVGTASQDLMFTGSGSALDDGAYGLDVDFGLDGSQFTRASCSIDLTATDVSFSMAGSSNNQLPWTATGMALTWEPRRTQRQ